MYRTTTTILFFLSITMLASCFQGRDYTRIRPNWEDLVGHWLPDDESIQLLASTQKYPLTAHYLILNNDSTFLLKNLPDWAWGTSPEGKFISGSGRWDIFENESGYFTHWSLLLRFEMRNESEVSEGFLVPLEGQRSPLIVHFILGDPDQDQFLRFVRSVSAGT